MSSKWGEQLRAFRLKAGYKTLSQFADALEANASLHLDVTTLSRYERKADRIPKQRGRHLKLLQVLVEGGGVATIAEANAWLRAGKMGYLTPQEQKALFPEAEQGQEAEKETTKGEKQSVSSPLSAAGSAAASSVSRSAWFIGIGGLLLIVLLGIFLLQRDDADRPVAVAPLMSAPSVAVTTPVAPASPGRTNLLKNDGFETDAPAPWTLSPDCQLASFALTANRADAYEGEQYLAAATNNPDCYFFRQDIPLTGPISDTLTFSIRARSADGAARRVTLALWTGWIEAGDFILSDVDNQTEQFLIGGEEWHCLETTLHLDHDWPRVVRAEIYLDSADGGEYHFDDAWVQMSGGGECPPPAAGLQNEGFEGSSSFPWMSAEDCPTLALQETSAAREGEQIAVASSMGAPCRSFFQDIHESPEVGDTYTFSIWGKSANEAPLSGEVVLWAEGGAAAKASVPFQIYGSEWRCLEVQLPIKEEGHNRIRAEVFLGTTDGSVYHFDDADFQLSEDAACPSQPVAWENDGFEDAVLFPWQDFDCDLMRIEDDGGALEGDQYLIAQRPLGEACISFYQDLPLLIEPGDVYRHSIWMRSSDGSPRRGAITLWAEGGIKENAGTTFVVSGDEWQCVETELVIAQENHTRLRGEVYLSQEGVEYFFDKARLEPSGESQCPLVDLYLGELHITDAGPFYAGSSVAVEAEIRNGGATAVPPRVTGIWIAREPNGPPIDPTRRQTVTLNDPLASGAGRVIQADVYIPLHLEPGEYHLVFEADNAHNFLEANEKNNRYSQSFTIASCADDMLFCDVPLDHWARREIEIWYHSGMTKGCHSEGVAYEDLTFCPNAHLDRATFTVFLLRHLEGANYRVESPYEGRFADVTPDTSFATWIEEIDRRNIVLDSDTCPQSGNIPQFCPHASLNRGDLARYLAQVLAWPLPETADGQFVDVAGDSLEARAITYMGQQGYLMENDPHCTAEGGRAFCPEKWLTRAEAAVMMARAFGLEPPQP